MKVIYHCYGGSHSSVTVAGIHLGLLPRDRIPSFWELLRVPHFDGNGPSAPGRFYFMGRDWRGNEVYVLGKRTLGQKFNLLLHKVADLFSCSGHFYPFDTTAFLNPLMVLGGFLSRRLKLVSLGRPLVVLGTQLAYFKFIQLVDQIEEKIREKEDEEEEIQKRKTPPQRRVVFYVNPEIFRIGLLCAGFHLYPREKESFVFNWAKKQENITGEAGALWYLGSDGDYDVYVVGAGGESHIVFRVLRELRGFLEVSEKNWYVAETLVKPSLFYLWLGFVLKVLGWHGALRFLEERVFHKVTDVCRDKVFQIRTKLKEGVLD